MDSRISPQIGCEETAAAELFAGLARVPGLAPSVQVAAGLLAAVARPPRADAWTAAARSAGAAGQAHALTALLSTLNNRTD